MIAKICRSLALVLILSTASDIRVAAEPVGSSPTPAYERIIKTYFGGWERKDWEQIAAQLGPGFTFSSPAPDDHLTVEQFKAKCWNQAAHIARFEFLKILGDDHEAMVIVHVVTTDNRIIRNIEYFTFRDGKIQSIEVFFGGRGQGFPTNKSE